MTLTNGYIGAIGAEKGLVPRQIGGGKEALYIGMDGLEQARGAFFIEFGEDIVQLEMYGAGMPRTSIETDLVLSRNYISEWPGYWAQLHGRHVELDQEHYYDTVLKPQGVVARIVAYNHPLMFAALRIASSKAGLLYLVVFSLSPVRKILRKLEASS